MACKCDLRKVALTNEPPESCQLVWDMFAKGLTKGCFQVETPLGKTWTKKIKPTSIGDLASICALIRPATLNAKDENGISITEHYCRRKNGQEEVTYFHPALEPITKRTYGYAIYQEQSIAICANLAGFSLTDSDLVRKGLGKKDAKLISELRGKFVEGAKKVGLINEQEANYIFDILEKGNRYCFNAAHAYAYGRLAYLTGWYKAHYPKEFMVSWLSHAKEDQDPKKEIYELVEEAKLFNINTLGPDLRNYREEFWTDGKDIHFGVAHIRDIGPSQVKKLQGAVKTLNKGVAEVTWMEFLTKVSPRVSSKVIQNLIKVGALPFKMLRSQMLEEFRIWCELNDKEQQLVAEGNFDTLEEALKGILKTKSEDKTKDGRIKHAKRLEYIKSLLKILLEPPTAIVDLPAKMAADEEELLGVALSCSRIDDFDTSLANCSCAEFLAGREGKVTLAVELVAVREWQAKNGTMAFLTLKDQTATLDGCVIFSENYAKYKEILTSGTVLLIEGVRDRKRGSFVANAIWRL